MFRTLTLTLAISGFSMMALSSTALAHPDPESDTSKSVAKMERPQLPSKTEIQDAIKQMPDMNAIMGDMMGIMKDERFRDNMESSARAFGNRLERSGALEKGADGMPDFNSAFAVMMETFSDEKAMGGMLDTMMGLANAMEKHVPETATKPARKTAPSIGDLQKEIDSLRAEVEQLRNEKASQ